MLKLKTTLYSLMALIVISSQALYAARGIKFLGVPAEDIADCADAVDIVVIPPNPAEEIATLTISSDGISCVSGTIKGGPSMHTLLKEFSDPNLSLCAVGNMILESNRILIEGTITSKQHIILNAS